MRYRIQPTKYYLCMILAGVLGVALGGCASQRTDLLKQGLVSLEPTVSKSFSHSPDVFEQDGELVVSGKLDRSEAPKGAHVDVWVISPDGTTLYEASVESRRPRIGGPRGGLGTNSPSTYSARFPALPPQGSVVHVKVNEMPHGKEGDN